jgi:hypothetical protein
MTKDQKIDVALARIQVRMELIKTLKMQNTADQNKIAILEKEKKRPVTRVAPGDNPF